jgi:hypothetical protein
MASLLAARRQHFAATLRLHAYAEAVRLGASASARLKCALWQNNPPLLLAIGNTQSQCSLFHPQRQNSPLASSAAGFEFTSVFDPCAQGQETVIGSNRLPGSLSRTLGELFLAPVFVVRGQEPVHVFAQQIVRR